MAQTIRQQLQAHAVALISLVVALGSLGYNTWRNELTEENRSIRLAAFETLKNLGELQVIVNFAYFAKDERLGHPMAGWGRVALISDLSMVLPSPAPERAEALLAVWKGNWQQISSDEASVDLVTAEIDQSREAIRKIVRDLR